MKMKVWTLILAGSLWIGGGLASQSAETTTHKKNSVEMGKKVATGKKKVSQLQLLANNYYGIPLYNLGHGLHVKVSINGKDGYFLVDSGAQSVYLAKEMAGHFGCKLTDSGEYDAGVGGKVKRFYANVNSFKLGGLVKVNLPLLPTVSMPESVKPVVDEKGHKYYRVGIIGNDVLKQLHASVDFVLQKILIPKGPKSLPLKTIFASKRTMRIPLKSEANYHYVTIGFGKGKKAQLMVDSGCDSMILCKAFCTKAGLPVKKGTDKESGVGVGGKSMQLYYTKPPEMALGKLKMTVGRIPVFDLGHMSSKRKDGLFGFRTLKQLNAVYDFAHDCIYVRY